MVILLWKIPQIASSATLVKAPLLVEEKRVSRYANQSNLVPQWLQ